MPQPRVSIIIVTWNGLPLLQQCLPSVLATKYDNFEVVVVDNGSEDGTLEWLESVPDVRVLAQSENLGFCGGNNVAIRETSSEFVVLLNNDVAVSSDWLTHLVSSVSRDPSIGAMQPKIRSYRDQSRFEYAGACGGHLDTYGYPFARGRIFSTVEEDDGQYDTSEDVFWASGAALLLRRSAIDETGLLDERLFMHMEEIDLCWRLQHRGWRVVVEPSSVVFHIGGASLSHANPRKVYLNFRNSLLLLYKHTSRRRWPALIARRFAFDCLAMIRAIVLLRPRESAAILRAFLDAHRMKSAFEPERPSSDDATLPSFGGSIVLEYFLLQRKTFNKLDKSRFRTRR